MTFRILQWNIRSFPHNKPFILSALSSLTPDVLCLQETWSSPSSSLTLPGFQLASRFDRPDTPGGGVAIFCTNSTSISPITLSTPLEAAAVRIHLPSITLTVVSLYLSPHLSTDSLILDLSSLLSSLLPPLLICTDANAHHTSWGSPTSDRRGNILVDWLAEEGLALLNTGHPTYLSSSGSFTHIDLSITSPSLAPSFSWKVNSTPFHSDHFPILIDTGLSLHHTFYRSPRYILSKANWPLFQKNISLPTNFISPTETCNQLEQAINSSASQSVPLSAGYVKPSFCKGWWTPTCSQALHRKNRALTCYKRSRGDLDLWVAYKRLRAVFRHTVLTAKKESWSAFISSITADTPSSVVWKKVKLLSSHPSSPTAIVLRSGDNFVSDPIAVSNLLATDFASRGSVATLSPEAVISSQNDPTSFTHSSTPWYNAPFTLLELSCALSSSRPTSPGPDGIPYAFPQHFSTSQLADLLQIFNYFWSTELPPQWKSSIVIPILKPGKPSTNPSSYRPIALTNCLCKLMERLVTLRLHTYLESNNILNPFQGGFRKGHSTLDSLCHFEDSIRSNLIQGNTTLAIFLDITQAFDSVWHPGLLRRLQDIGLEGNLPYFISNFLHGRSISVRLRQGATSSAHPTSCGVPQGSVISPVLFLLMINDIIHPCPPSIHYSLYADDCAIWTSDHSPDVCLTRIQAVLNSIEAWSSHTGLALSPSKSKAMFFSRRRNLPLTTPLTLSSYPLAYVSQFRFLGLLFDSHLTWRPHCVALRERCSKDLRLLRIVSSRGWGADSTSLRSLYISLTRSKLQYGSLLFHTAARTTLEILDRIQYAAARIILGVLRCTPVSLLESASHLMPLSLCRRLTLSQYACRVLSVPGNPFRDTILSYYPFEFYSHQRLPLPISGRIFHEIQQIGLMFRDIPSVPLHSRYRIFSPPVYSSLHSFNKDSLPSFHWRSLFLSLVAEYPNHTQVFCDGSLKGALCGCAVWSASFSLQAKLPPGSSIFTAELYAIFCAASYVSTLPGRFLILTDSLSSVSALAPGLPGSHYLVPKIASLLSGLPQNKITVQWVPSHVGIPGNELADAMAKRSLHLSYTTQIPFSADDIRLRLKTHYNNLWQAHWNSATASFPVSVSNIHSIPPYFSVPRREQIVITRLYLRTCLLTHLHVFKKSSPPECTTCHLPLNLSHLLITCPALEHARAGLRAQCLISQLTFDIDSVLHVDFPAETLIAFLRQTDLFTSI